MTSAEQAREVVAAGATEILLDNMSVAAMAEYRRGVGRSSRLSRRVAA